MAVSTIPGSSLFRLSQTSLQRGTSFSATQAQFDSAVIHVLEEATNTSTLAALLTGTGASRLARTGILAMGSSATGWAARGVQAAGAMGSLSAEVVAFEGMSRGLVSLSGRPSSPNLWRWDGEGGWRQGLFTSGITFTSLRGAGHVARGQNIVFQHAAQSLSMVAGHNAAAAFHLIPTPEGSLTHQLFEAEMTNVQLSAMMGAFHLAAPGFHAFERSLDLANSSRVGANPLFAREGGNSLQGSHSLLATATGSRLPSEMARPEDSPIRNPRQNPHLVLSEGREGSGSRRITGVYGDQRENFDGILRYLKGGALEPDGAEDGYNRDFLFPENKTSFQYVLRFIEATLGGREPAKWENIVPHVHRALRTEESRRLIRLIEDGNWEEAFHTFDVPWQGKIELFGARERIAALAVIVETAKRSGQLHRLGVPDRNRWDPAMEFQSERGFPSCLPENIEGFRESLILSAEYLERESTLKDFYHHAFMADIFERLGETQRAQTHLRQIKESGVLDPSDFIGTEAGVALKDFFEVDMKGGYYPDSERIGILREKIAGGRWNEALSLVQASRDEYWTDSHSTLAYLTQIFSNLTPPKKR